MIPVVDCKKGLSSVGTEILNAFETVGFVYLINHNVDKQAVDRVFAVLDRFWQLTPEERDEFARPKQGANTGYVASGVEILDAKNTGELREAYNITPVEGQTMIFPDEKVPEFRKTTLDFFDKCWVFGQELMRVMAIHLHLSPNFFAETHTYVDLGQNMTTLRLLNYPLLPTDIEAGQVRCGEHSDYGTFTLLFQDDVGGLQVQDRTGKFVFVTPVENAILINAGDLLERWTNGRIMAMKHRVLVPADDKLKNKHRRSVAFFIHPDDSVLVQPLDGSTTYSPITAKQHVINMFSRNY